MLHALIERTPSLSEPARPRHGPTVLGVGAFKRSTISVRYQSQNFDGRPAMNLQVAAKIARGDIH